MIMNLTSLRYASFISLGAMSLALTACGGSGGTAFLTLDGSQPLVIGHRGLPGLFPEETQPS